MDDIAISTICYHAPKLIVKLDGINYYCADKEGVSDFADGLVFNLTNQPMIPNLSHIPFLNDHVNRTYEEIMIAWPDYGVPKLKATFWSALHNFAVGKGATKVCVHCAGGHGRTGTAISSLLIANKKNTMPEAVNFIRKTYCELAVETQEQCDYLCDLDEELNGIYPAHKDIPEPSSVIMAKRIQQKRESEKNIQAIIKKYIGPT